MEIVYKDESYAIMGACFEVYKELGCGFLEPVYQECLAIELTQRKIPYIEQDLLQIKYKGFPIEQRYKPDFICYEKIILELKALKIITDIERAKMHNYLKITGFKLGLLINFGQYPKLEYERIVR